jgi:hypothetical protein
VVSGAADGTLFCFGHGNLGKSHTMIGRDESSRTIGLTPTAIAWLFRCLKERRERTAANGVRVSVRVSAMEIVGSGEELRDLLVGHGTETEPTGKPVFSTSSVLPISKVNLFAKNVQNLEKQMSADVQQVEFLLCFLCPVVSYATLNMAVL